MMLQKGFTLIELLVVITLVSILLGLASVTWIHLREHQQQRLLVNRITSALQYARSVAVQRNKEIVYCGSSDRRHCDGQWTMGQIIKNGNKILREYVAFPSGCHLTWRSSFGQNDALIFAPSGFTAGQQGSFLVCSKSSKQCKKIVISRSGRVRLTL